MEAVLQEWANWVPHPQFLIALAHFDPFQPLPTAEEVPQGGSALRPQQRPSRPILHPGESAAQLSLGNGADHSYEGSGHKGKNF